MRTNTFTSLLTLILLTLTVTNGEQFTKEVRHSSVVDCTLSIYLFLSKSRKRQME